MDHEEVRRSAREWASRLIGTDQGADLWLGNPNSDLGGESPEALIAAGRGDMVLQYLDWWEFADPMGR